MFAETYLENAARCFSRWMELIVIDRKLATDYHCRARELVSMAAKASGKQERDVRAIALRRAVMIA